jgi:hypothetical protein
MTVVATFAHTCEACGKVANMVIETDLYSDPVVMPPEGWGYLKDENTFACAECVAKERGARL